MPLPIAVELPLLTTWFKESISKAAVALALVGFINSPLTPFFFTLISKAASKASLSIPKFFLACTTKAGPELSLPWLVEAAAILFISLSTAVNTFWPLDLLNIWIPLLTAPPAAPPIATVVASIFPSSPALYKAASATP